MGQTRPTRSGVLRVLHMEDAAFARELVRERLEREGLTVVQACDGEEGLALYADGAFDVLIVDHNMPRRNGMEVLRALAAEGSMPATIMLTGRNDAKLAVEALRLGACDYLLKGADEMSMDLLVGAIERAVERQRLERERDRAVDALRMSAAQNRAIVDTAPDAIVTINQEDVILTWNLAAEGMFGYSASHAIGRRLSRLIIPPARRAEHLAGLCRCWEAGDAPLTSRRWELTAMRADGSPFPIELTVSKTYVDGTVQFLGIMRDVTTRKRSESERSFLAAAVEQAMEAVVITNTEGTIAYVNAAFERVTGYSRAEALGQTPRILKSGHQDAAFYADLWSTIEAGEVWRGHFVNRRKDGTRYEEDAVITPVRDESGAIVRYVAVKRDVTEALAMEVQLRQSQKLEAAGALAAGIAHEINTPIQFVGDNTRFMADAFTDVQQLIEAYEGLKGACTKPEQNGQGVADALARVVEAERSADMAYLSAEIPKATAQTLDGVNRVAKIVHAMRQFSHPGGGDHTTAADLNDALDSTLTVARNELKYVADVETDLDPDLPLVHCHLGDINQVFLNILINAAHAIAAARAGDHAPKGRITVSTRSEGETVVIAIGDTGTGIPEAVRDRVFDPFFTTKEVGRGTGQGLSIAHSVVVGKHGGSLTFDTAPGVGTTFYIRLPVQPKEGDHAQ